MREGSRARAYYLKGSSIWVLPTVFEMFAQVTPTLSVRRVVSISVCYLIAGANDDIHLLAHEFFCRLRETIRLPVGERTLHRNVLSQALCHDTPGVGLPGEAARRFCGF